MPEDYFNMQKDALRRAKEMYSRGKYNTPLNQINKEKIEFSNKEIEKTANSKPKNDMLSFLLKDKDKTIILALLILLSSEKTDMSLMFALMYLLI